MVVLKENPEDSTLIYLFYPPFPYQLSRHKRDTDGYFSHGNITWFSISLCIGFLRHVPGGNRTQFSRTSVDWIELRPTIECSCMIT